MKTRGKRRELSTQRRDYMDIAIWYEGTCSAFKVNSELVSSHQTANDLCCLLRVHVRLRCINILSDHKKHPDAMILFGEEKFTSIFPIPSLSIGVYPVILHEKATILTLRSRENTLHE